MNPRTGRPASDEHVPMFAGYISLVPDGDIVDLLRTQIRHTRGLVADISGEQADHAYAPGKWTVREVVGHLVDVERVMVSRALFAARGDPADLPPFDENAWLPVSGFADRSMASIVAEFDAVREATVSLFDGLPDEAWMRRCTSNGRPFSVRAIAAIISGHERHHTRILVERYGLKPA